MTSIPNVLTIAGSDSSGGAGIQADIKTFTALNVYGASVVTNITAQNTLGVHSIHPLPVQIVEEQLEAVLTDIKFDAIKIGMLYSEEIICLVAEILKRYTDTPIIIDPVLVSSSGRDLLQPSAIRVLINELFPLAYLITPNLPEAARLLERDTPIDSEQADLATIELAERFQCNILLKGGHGDGSSLVDRLYAIGTTSHGHSLVRHFSHAKLRTKNTHGTGCTLASALSSYIANGQDLEFAAESAINYLHHAIQGADHLSVGRGHGPVKHFTIANSH